MNSILQLPASVRIVIFVFEAFALAALTFCVVYGLFCRRSKWYLGYLTSLFVTLFVFAVTRTPLTEGQNVNVATYFQLALALPVATGLLLFVKERKLFYLADVVWCVFDLPWWERVIPFYGYFAAGLVAYMLGRVVWMALDILRQAERYPGRLSIKYALDQATDGIAFVNVFGHVTYINRTLADILAGLGLSSYDRAQALVAAVKAMGVDGRSTDTSCIVKHKDKAYRFAWDDPLSQISVTDVTKEEELLERIEQGKTLLAQAGEELTQEVQHIDEIQAEKELLAIKGELHDNLAQQLSILHMVLLEDQSPDLREVKRMLSTLTLPEPSTETKADPDELVELLAVIGVRLTIVGDIRQDARRLFVCKLLKEASTNAIKHGRAREVEARLDYDDEGNLTVIILNDGVPPQDVREGNGLTSLKEQARALGGEVEVRLDPFAIVAKLPETRNA